MLSFSKIFFSKKMLLGLSLGLALPLATKSQGKRKEKNKINHNIRSVNKNFISKKDLKNEAKTALSIKAQEIKQEIEQEKYEKILQDTYEKNLSVTPYIKTEMQEANKYSLLNQGFILHNKEIILKESLLKRLQFNPNVKVSLAYYIKSEEEDDTPIFEKRSNSSEKWRYAMCEEKLNSAKRWIYVICEEKLDSLKRLRHAIILDNIRIEYGYDSLYPEMQDIFLQKKIKCQENSSHDRHDLKNCCENFISINSPKNILPSLEEFLLVDPSSGKNVLENHFFILENFLKNNLKENNLNENKIIFKLLNNIQQHVFSGNITLHQTEFFNIFIEQLYHKINCLFFLLQQYKILKKDPKELIFLKNLRYIVSYSNFCMLKQKSIQNKKIDQNAYFLLQTKDHSLKTISKFVKDKEFVFISEWDVLDSKTKIYSYEDAQTIFFKEEAKGISSENSLFVLHRGNLYPNKPNIGLLIPASRFDSLVFSTNFLDDVQIFFRSLSEDVGDVVFSALGEKTEKNSENSICAMREIKEIEKIQKLLPSEHVFENVTYSIKISPLTTINKDRFQGELSEIFFDTQLRLFKFQQISQELLFFTYFVYMNLLKFIEDFLNKSFL